MPRKIIYFDQSVIDRLKKHTKERYGNRRVLSVIVQYAVVKYLDDEDNKSGKRKQASGSRPKAF